MVSVLPAFIWSSSSDIVSPLVKESCVSVNVSEPGSDHGRIASNQRDRDRRQRHEVPQQSPQPQDLGVALDVHSDRRRSHAHRRQSTELEEKILRFDVERILLQQPADDDHEVRSQRVYNRAAHRQAPTRSAD